MIKFRDLTANDIDVRVASISKTGKGLSLLLYKNARVDMAILDDTVGIGAWQRDHYECKGNLFCRVGIKFDDEWIWKSDCGSESNTEKQKGEASDSFKRACFNWGIGRELYTAPFIWVNSEDCTITNGKCYDKFYVSKIEIKDKQITSLVINNSKTNKSVFMIGYSMSSQNCDNTVSAEQLLIIGENKDNPRVIKALEYYKKEPKDLTFDEATKVVKVCK